MITCQRLVTLLHKPLVKVKEGEGRASGHCVVWVVSWLVGWLTGFESDERLSDYVRDKPLVKVGWAGGKGLAS